MFFKKKEKYSGKNSPIEKLEQRQEPQKKLKQNEKVWDSGKNRVKPEIIEREKEEAKAKKHKKDKGKKFKERSAINFSQLAGSILDGSFLTRDKVISLLPFGMFIVFLAMIYIANSYSGIRRVKEIDKLGKELKELRIEHISTKSKLMYQSKISEVAKRLETQEIKESVIPPKKIMVKDQAK